MTKRKSFIDAPAAREGSNPALSFISSESIAAVEGAAPLQADTDTPPEGYKINPKFVEIKSKRVQLVLQPSLYTRVKEASEAAGLSLNEYVHRLLDEATAERK